MRTFSKITTCVIVTCVMLMSALMVSTATAQWPQTTAHNPWSLEIGAKAMERPGTKGTDSLISNSITNETLFNSDDATDLGVAPAAEVKFNFQSPTGQEFEIRSILANWDQSITPIAGPNIRSPFFTQLTTPDLFEFDHDADFYSVELMARRAVRPGLVLMAGPRVVSTKDSVRTTSTKVVNPGGGVPNITVVDIRDTEATNLLLGLQTGFEINRPIANGIYVSSFMRLGGYFNPTEVNFDQTSPLLPAPTFGRITKSTGSFLGEVGGRLIYDFVPNCFSGYVGYEANWIDGIAFAPNQFLQTLIPAGPAVGPPPVDTANTIFFQGVTFGLKFTY